MNIKTINVRNNFILSTFTLSVLLNITVNCYADTSNLEPLFTKSAQIYSDTTIDTNLGYFNDRELEEIESFDAYEVLFNISVPVSQNAQFRLTWPAYTNGDGKLKKTGSSTDGKSVDIDENASTYEFLTLSLEYQLMNIN